MNNRHIKSTLSYLMLLLYASFSIFSVFSQEVQDIDNDELTTKSQQPIQLNIPEKEVNVEKVTDFPLNSYDTLLISGNIKAIIVFDKKNSIQAQYPNLLIKNFTVTQQKNKVSVKTNDSLFSNIPVTKITKKVRTSLPPMTLIIHAVSLSNIKIKKQVDLQIQGLNNTEGELELNIQGNSSLSANSIVLNKLSLKSQGVNKIIIGNIDTTDLSFNFSGIHSLSIIRSESNTFSLTSKGDYNSYEIINLSSNDSNIEINGKENVVAIDTVYFSEKHQEKNQNDDNPIEEDIAEEYTSNSEDIPQRLQISDITENLPQYDFTTLENILNTFTYKITGRKNTSTFNQINVDTISLENNGKSSVLNSKNIFSKDISLNFNNATSNKMDLVSSDLIKFNISGKNKFSSDRFIGKQALFTVDGKNSINITSIKIEDWMSNNYKGKNNFNNNLLEVANIVGLYTGWNELILNEINITESSQFNFETHNIVSLRTIQAKDMKLFGTGKNEISINSHNGDTIYLSLLGKNNVDINTSTNKEYYSLLKGNGNTITINRIQGEYFTAYNNNKDNFDITTLAIEKEVNIKNNPNSSMKVTSLKTPVFILNNQSSFTSEEIHVASLTLSSTANNAATNFVQGAIENTNATLRKNAQLVAQKVNFNNMILFANQTSYTQIKVIDNLELTARNTSIIHYEGDPTITLDGTPLVTILKTN